MPETLTQAQRSRNMAAIKGRDTKPELAVRSMLHSAGYRFRLHKKDLPGCPDIVLPKIKAAIFVHGCFWHMHSCRRGQSTPAANAAFWSEKRSKTTMRDRAKTQELGKLGWSVIVVWECDILSGRYEIRLLRKLASLRERLSGI